MASNDEEDDYMTMILPEPSTTSTKHETITAKRRRLAREAEAKRPKSKAELAEEEAAKREQALNTPLPEKKSKGFAMMQKLGYKPGMALGKPATESTSATDAKDRDGRSRDASQSPERAADGRLLNPIAVEMKEGRSGIGLESDQKRKFREQTDSIKRQKVDQNEYRERQRAEVEEKRLDGQWWGAMKVADSLDEQEREKQSTASKQRPRLNKVNVLWRPLVKQRSLDERERRLKQEINRVAMSRGAVYGEDPELDADDNIALGKDAEVVDEIEDVDEEDAELQEYLTLPAQERLDKIVAYLRDAKHYCFWCKAQYDDKNMEGCPGESEDEHG